MGRWFLLPEPDNPVDVFRLATELFQSGHALPAMMLRVHRDLNNRFGDRYGAGRIGKPRNCNDIRQTVGCEACPEFA